MPERWERELGKLRGVEMQEPSVRERIERGPKAQRLPGRERVVAAIVAFAVFGAAGAFAWRALLPAETSGPIFGPGSWPVATVSLGSGPEGKSATLSVGGSTQVGVFGVATSPDEPYPYAWVNPTLPTLAQPLPIPMGSELDLDGDVTIKELLYGDAQQLDEGRGPDSGPIWADQPDFSEPYFLPWDEQPERTYLKFFGTWADGSVLDVYFEVVFVAPDVDLMDPNAEIVVTPEPMGAAFLYGGQRSPMGVEGGTYGNMSITSDFAGFDERAIVAKVPAGTALEIGGDHLVDASIRAGSLPFGEGGTPLDESMPTEAGRYVLTMEVTWDGGSARFLHQIEVVPAPEAGGTPVIGNEPSPAPGSPGSVVVDIRRISEETGDPEAHARLGDQDVWMCPDGWSLLTEDGTTERTVFDCGQGKDFVAPTGTPIVVAGDFDSVHVTARVSADGTRPASDVVPDLDPGTVVTLTYEVTWADGSRATFWFHLTVTERQTEQPSDVLRVRCGPGGTEVLTPIVAAQPDGLHIVPVDIPAGWTIGVTSLASDAVSLSSYWSGSDGVDDAFIRPVPPGDAGVGCHEGTAMTDVDMERLAAEGVPFQLTDPGRFFRSYTPSCDEADFSYLLPSSGISSEWRGVDPEKAADRIRQALTGVKVTDNVERAGYGASFGSRSWWRIVRDGRIVAGLSVGEQGGGTAHGWSCRSSGIAQGSVG